MYIIDAIKEINPKKTYDKCLSILDDFDLSNKGLIKYININYKAKNKFNCYISSGSINFGPIFGINNIIITQNGKGLTYEQCMSSMYMEIFERLATVINFIGIVNKNENNFYYNNSNIDSNIEQMIKVSKLLYNTIEKHLTDIYQINISLNIPNISQKSVYFNNLINNKNINLPKIVYYYNGSDGLSSGNTKSEAILGGIYEVIERYCIKSFFENKKNISSKKICIKNLVKQVPELRKTITSINSFDEIETSSLIEIHLKGTHIYTYIYFCKTTGEYSNFGSGTHTDKRIGIIRAISEVLQVLLPSEIKINSINKLKKNNIWGFSGDVYISNFFSSNIIEKKILGVKNEISFKKNNISYSNIDELLDNTIKDLKKINIKYILVKNVSLTQINIPVYVVKIPEFGLLWYFKYNNFFYKINNNSKKEIIIPYNIKGLNKIFYYVIISNNIKIDLSEQYSKLLYLLEDSNLEIYIKKYYNISYNKKNLEKEKKYYEKCINYNNIDRIKLEKEDPDSFVYFRKILKKKRKNKSDFLYLFKTYCSIGFIDYAVYYIKQERIDITEDNDFKEVYNKTFDKLHKIANDNGKNSDFSEAYLLYKKLKLTIQNVPKKWLEN